MRKGQNWFWGILLVLAGALVIVAQFTHFAHLNMWVIILGVVLAAILINSLVRRSWFGAAMSLAFLYIVLQRPLHLFYIRPWLLIVAALLVGKGLSMLFRRRPDPIPPYHQPPYDQTANGEWGAGHSGPPSHGGWQTQANSQADGDNYPTGKVNFGAASRYLHAAALEGGQFYLGFGAMDIYFDQATLAPGGARVFLDCSFGAFHLYIPRHWQVVDNLSTTAAGIQNDTRYAAPAPDAPVLELYGNIQFGSVEITYV
ncbi:cell wall-active antibiotics response protein [Ruminococcaceae bacterium OttesenSCG-928-O06]|nr:cell wall-active antibiotics response protein [Ruminococcaceae bacterium OttesenSCG-928-O06]